MSDSSRRAVNIRIGTSALSGWRRIARQTATPSTFGSIRSRTTRSKRFGLDLPNRFVAGRGLGDGQAFEAEMESDELANVRFVLDDEGATPNDARTVDP